MRLVSTMIAVLFALSLAIFPISGMRSAAVMGHHHQHSAGAHHASAHSLPGELAADELASATDDCSSHKAPHGKQTGCCDMGACHAFTVAPLATFAYSALLMGSIADRRDEQARGELSARIERPPRTV